MERLAEDKGVSNFVTFQPDGRLAVVEPNGNFLGKYSPSLNILSIPYVLEIFLHSTHTHS